MAPITPDPATAARLAATYAQAIDRRRFDDLRVVFTDDAVLVTRTSRREGIDAIIATMDGLLRYRATVHQLGQSTVLADDGAVTAETYCTAHHLHEVDGITVDRVMLIRYQDRLVETSDGWRIAERALAVDASYDQQLS